MLHVVLFPGDLDGRPRRKADAARTKRIRAPKVLRQRQGKSDTRPRVVRRRSKPLSRRHHELAAGKVGDVLVVLLGVRALHIPNMEAIDKHGHRFTVVGVGGVRNQNRR